MSDRVVPEPEAVDLDWEVVEVVVGPDDQSRVPVLGDGRLSLRGDPYDLRLVSILDIDCVTNAV